MKILFLSAEVYPFAKVGGLADVVGSLPKVLHNLGHDVRVIMPAYRSIEDGYLQGDLDIQPLESNLQVPLGGGPVEAGVFEGRLPNSEVPVYFIAKGDLLGRYQVYGYDDDAYRFSFFARAALQLAVEALDWRPDVVHTHDWHTAPAVIWLATAGQSDERYRDIPTLFTIHNLAHQGHAPWQVFDYLGVITHSLHEEPYGMVNFMARAIYHATKISTVSPSYAQEIMTVQGGAGLDGLLRHRHLDLHGILNGLDVDVWNPATDPNLAAPFDLDRFGARQANKAALQQELGLEIRPDVPLLAMVSRLDWQKGLDLMGEVVHRLLTGESGPAQLAILGSGEQEYERMFAQFAQRYPSQVSATFEYNPKLAPRLYAGSDMFLMPSLFEPCGLGQLIAMRYGSVPIVRGTGGLMDTVQDSETGFIFDGYSTDAFWQAVQRATYIYNLDPDRWRGIQLKGMTQNFSWENSAVQYELLYRGCMG